MHLPHGTLLCSSSSWIDWVHGLKWQWWGSWSARKPSWKPADVESGNHEYPGACTGWQRGIQCRNLPVSFRKRANKYRALLLKETFKDKASYASLPPCDLWCVLVQIPLSVSVRGELCKSIKRRDTMSKTNHQENSRAVCRTEYNQENFPHRIFLCLSSSWIDWVRGFRWQWLGLWLDDVIPRMHLPHKTILCLTSSWIDRVCEFGRMGLSSWI